MAMVESDLTFGQSTANMRMAVSKDNRILNSEHIPNLASSWGDGALHS